MKQYLNSDLVDLTPEEIDALQPLPKSPEDMIEEYRLSIQSRLDARAQERNYENGHTIATYVNSTIPSWAAEAQAFVAWRDQVWSYAFTEMAKVELGQREAPTLEAFCEELPSFDWPE